VGLGNIVFFFFFFTPPNAKTSFLFFFLPPSFRTLLPVLINLVCIFFFSTKMIGTFCAGLGGGFLPPFSPGELHVFHVGEFFFIFGPLVAEPLFFFFFHERDIVWLFRFRVFLVRQHFFGHNVMSFWGSPPFPPNGKQHYSLSPPLGGLKVILFLTLIRNIPPPPLLKTQGSQRGVVSFFPSICLMRP